MAGRLLLGRVGDRARCCSVRRRSRTRSSSASALWGNNIPVAWAFAIINFVWWIGIGHAGTFISAILLLLEQHWRTSINRFAEAMTLFAVMQAGDLPAAPPRPAVVRVLARSVPGARWSVWPKFRSALPWDVAAVVDVLHVSLLFWYLGPRPRSRDRCATRAPSRLRRTIYGLFALGWRGSAQHWRHYRIAYGVLAGLATPLVVSVHSVVSQRLRDRASCPGWHSTIFPPYFVAGAIFSGFAMVLDADDPDAPRRSGCRTSSRRATSTTWRS